MRKIGAYSDGSFYPLARGLDNSVLSINKDPRSGAILIGGLFGKAFDRDNNAMTVDGIVAWNDSTWLPFAGILDGYRRVEEIFVGEDNAILIAGRFEDPSMGKYLTTWLFLMVVNFTPLMRVPLEKMISLRVWPCLETHFL